MSLNYVIPLGSPYSTLHTGMVQAQQSIQKVAESITTGINATINPADSYVASVLNTDIREAHKAIENAQTGYNFTSVADSSLAGITENLNRIRELSTQAANGIYSDEQVAVFQEEINQNIEHIQQTLNNATFNGHKTLNAVTPANPQPIAMKDFFVESNTSGSISYDPNITLDSFNFDVSTPEAARDAIGQIDAMLGDINAKRGEIGAVQTSFTGAIEQQTANITTNSQALSSIQDTDYVSAIAELKKSEYSMELMAKVMKMVMNSEKYVLNML